MSLFTSTQPQNGVRHLIAVAVVAAVAFVIPFASFKILLETVAVNQAHHHIAEFREETIVKLKAEEKKKLPKGAKPDDKALTEAAEHRFTTDAKVKAAFEKKAGELEHHAQGGLFPMAVFLSLVTAIITALWGSILLVKRNKDAGVSAWPALLAHFPTAAFFTFIAAIPLLGYLAHHEGVSLAQVIKENTPVLLGFFLACIGAGVQTILVLLPSGRGCGDHHGESCGHSH